MVLKLSELLWELADDAATSLEAEQRHPAWEALQRIEERLVEEAKEAAAREATDWDAKLADPNPPDWSKATDPDEPACGSSVTHRDEEHQQSVCTLPEGHDGSHDDGSGCIWNGPATMSAANPEDWDDFWRGENFD